MKAPMKILAAISSIALIGLAGIAFAHGGWGGGYSGDGHMMGGGDGHMMGPGGHMGYGYGRGEAGITDAQREELAASRDAFFKAAEGLREDVYHKRGELARELDRNNPDAGKVRELQKELSALKADFDRKRLAHRMELKKIAPELGRGFHGRGAGGNHGGYCWN